MTNLFAVYIVATYFIQNASPLGIYRSITLALYASLVLETASQPQLDLRRKLVKYITIRRDSCAIDLMTGDGHVVRGVQVHRAGNVPESTAVTKGKRWRRCHY